MSTHTLPRLAGGALVTGSVLSILGFALTDLQSGTPTPASVKSPVYLGGSLLIYAGAVLVLFGLPGLPGHIRQHHHVPDADRRPGHPGRGPWEPARHDGRLLRCRGHRWPGRSRDAGHQPAAGPRVPRWIAIVLFVAAAAFPFGGALENLPPILAAVAMLGIGARLIGERPEVTRHPADVAAPAAA